MPEGLAQKPAPDYFKRLTLAQRASILDEYLVGGRPITSICEEYGISRPTFYKWLRRYEQAGKKPEALEDKPWKISYHPKQIPWDLEKKIIHLAIKHPHLSTHKIAQLVRDVGNHGVQSVFEKHGLNLYERRLKFRYKKLIQTPWTALLVWGEELLFLSIPLVLLFFVGKLTYDLLSTAPTGFEMAGYIFAEIALVVGSFFFLYSLKYYLTVTLVLASSRAQGGSYARENGYSNGSNGSNGSGIRGFKNGSGIFKRFLRGRNGLNGSGRDYIGGPLTYKGVGRPPRGFLSPYETPLLNGNGKFYPDNGGGNGSFSPFHRGLAGKLFGKYLPSAGKLNGFNGSNGNGNGLPAAGKGGLSAEGGNGNGYNGNGPAERGKGGLPAGGRNGTNGWGSVEEFERQFASEVNRVRPFVSIHLPLYNEKRVADRLLEACSHLTYKNYEVVVIDDSDDGTTDIIRSWQDRLVGEGDQSNVSDVGNHSNISNGNGGIKRGEIREYTLPDGTFVREARSADRRITLKLIHRPTREGFKGGALNHALRVTDPKTSYIAVFDADFIPFPDTIEAFLKYFYFLSGGLPSVGKEGLLAGKAGKGNLSAAMRSFGRIAAVQGYQWHILNKDENWITQGVRYEYAGSYVIERSGTELFGTLKQIAGSVYMIRKDLLEQFGWGHSITEDFQLTLRLYEQGYKVVYTPYIQTPAECVSTLKRLIRQRMRWAEGHTHNVRLMFKRLIDTPFMATREKLEFIYLSPYYLQAAFLITGTFFWFTSEIFFKTKLPFWTSVWGWGLVVTNFLSLPLMNAAGLFIEEGERKDYQGLFSFIALTYILAPFQAWASLKGLLEKAEGPWFRTPKTGLITISLARAHFARILKAILPGRGRAPRPALSQAINPTGWEPFPPEADQPLAETPSGSSGGSGPGGFLNLSGSFRGSVYGNLREITGKRLAFLPSPIPITFPRRRRLRFLSKGVLAILIIFTVTVYNLSQGVPETLATNPSSCSGGNCTLYLSDDADTLLTAAGEDSWKLLETLDSPSNTNTQVSFAKNAGTGWLQLRPGANNSTFESAGSCTTTSGDGDGWIYENPFQQSGGSIAAGAWTFYFRESDNLAQADGHLDACAWRVKVTSGSLDEQALLFDTSTQAAWSTADIWFADVSNYSSATDSVGAFSFNADEYIYVEFYAHFVSDAGPGTRTQTFATGDVSEAEDPRVVLPQITIPEMAILFLAAAPLVPYVVQMWVRRRQGLAGLRRV